MKPEYPEELLPSDTYVSNLDIEELHSENPSLSVVRQYSGEIRYTENGQPTVTDDMWPSSNRIIGLSMTLLGGLYEADKHLPFLPKSARATLPWDGKRVDIKSFDSNDYSFDSEAVGIYIPVSDIQCQAFPYNCTFPSADKRDECEKTAVEIQTRYGLKLEKAAVGVFTRKDIPVETYAVTKIIHNPVMLNYWHVTMEALPLVEEDFIQDRDSARVKRLSKLIRKYLSGIASFVQPVFYSIPPTCYTKFDLTGLHVF